MQVRHNSDLRVHPPCLRNKPGMRSLLLVAWIVSLMAWPATAARGQDSGTTQPAVQPEAATDVAGAELKLEDVEARISQVEAATDMEEAVKAEVLGLYRQALEHIQVAETWAARIAKFEQSRQGAPAELAGIRERLEQAATQPVAQPLPGFEDAGTLEELERKLSAAEAELDARQQTAKEADDDAQRWSERRASLPQELVAANARREQLAQELSAATRRKDHGAGPG